MAQLKSPGLYDERIQFDYVPAFFRRGPDQGGRAGASPCPSHGAGKQTSFPFRPNANNDF